MVQRIHTPEIGLFAPAVMADDDVSLPRLVGILEKLKRQRPYEDNSFLLTRKFFPSKVGGKPAWLVPDECLSSDIVPFMSCDACGKSMSFLIQIYAPVESAPHAFHRTIFCLFLPKV